MKTKTKPSEDGQEVKKKKKRYTAVLIKEFPTKVHTEFKVACIREGISMQEKTIYLIEQWLADLSATQD